jgi:[ribosomal protein S18]-alanine N-acetyltransferase
MKLQTAVLADAKAIEAVENDNFTPQDFGLSLACIRYHLQKNIVFVAKKQSCVVGYILFLRRKNFYRLYSFAVLKEYQGSGVGKNLLGFAIERLSDKPLQLEVKYTNFAAIALYEKFGFEKAKVLPSYYPNAIDAYLMKRK